MKTWSYGYYNGVMVAGSVRVALITLIKITLFT